VIDIDDAPEPWAKGRARLTIATIVIMHSVAADADARGRRGGRGRGVAVPGRSRGGSGGGSAAKSARKVADNKARSTRAKSAPPATKAGSAPSPRRHPTKRI